MAHSKFSLDGPAFGGSTRQVIQPSHIMELQEEEEVLEAGVDTQVFQIPPGLPAPQEEQEGQTGDDPENSLLKCVMEDARDRLRAFQEFEHYVFGDNSRSDCDVPEDEHTDEMEDVFSDEDQLVPVNLQEEEDPTFQRDHDQLSPGSIPLEDITAIQEDQLDPVNLREEEDPTEEDHDLPSPGIIPVENFCREEDHLIPVKLQVEEGPTEGDHDQPSRPGNIQLEDILGFLANIEEDQFIPVNLREKDFTVQGDHDQPNPVIIPVENITAIEGNETSPVNLHVTLVNVQVTAEPEDPSTPRRLDLNIATFDSLYREADKEVIPEIQLDVEVQTVTTTSAAEGESSTSSRILMDIHVDPKPHESEDSYELLHEAVNDDSPDLKDVNETPLKRAIEAGAPET